jgi:hypothetical protein
VVDAKFTCGVVATGEAFLFPVIFYVLTHRYCSPACLNSFFDKMNRIVRLQTHRGVMVSPSGRSATIL